MTPRDELVELLGHDDWCDYADKSPEGCEEFFGCTVWRRADRILASDWLAKHNAAIWDEGLAASTSGAARLPNPYRTTEPKP